MLNGELTKERINVRRLTKLYNQTLETEDSKRTKLLKELFGSTGKNTHIEPSFKCDYGYNIHLG